jgi:ubiquinone biosynthesis protein
MLSKTRRLFTIFAIFRRYGLFIILAERYNSSFVKWLNWGASSRKYKQLSEAQRIHQALQTLGPLFIKLGQSLSTRPDLISPEIAEELTLLHDQVPAFDSAVARASIEKELGSPISDLFESFEDVPMGSASIAQVHGAVLHDGSRVVVKILRPGIEDIIARDIALLYALASIMKWVSNTAVQFQIHEVIEELDKTLRDELDLVREAANSSVLRRHCMDQANVRIPAVYWDFTATRVATFERIHGISIDDIDRLKAAGINCVQLARLCLEMFFTQVFRDCYFHADLHPGNMFVGTPDLSGQATLILVDFGIMGTLSTTDQRYLAQNLMAFIHRDYRKVARLHIESGWVPALTRIDDFEAAIRAVCEPMFERPIQDISFGKLLLRLFETARRFDMHIQPQLILLQKTILNIEGVARQLDPQLNVWDTARPIIEKWMRSQYSFTALLKQLNDALPTVMAKLPQILKNFQKEM